MPRRLPQGNAWDILQYEALRTKAGQHPNKILFARYGPSTFVTVLAALAVAAAVITGVRWVGHSGILDHLAEIAAVLGFLAVVVIAFRPRGRNARIRTRQARSRRLR